MKKEVILAIAIGLMLGLGITFVVYQAKTQIAEPPTTIDLAEIGVESTEPAAPEASDLVILSPEDESVQTDTALLVRGKTIAESHIVVFAGDETYLTQADTEGDFSVSLELEQGATTLKITVLTSGGTKLSQNRTVTVSDELEISAIEDDLEETTE